MMCTHTRLSRTILFCLLCFCSAFSLRAAEPKLIVVVSYDQLRGDRIGAFKDELGTKGFLRVMNEGVVYDSCLYNHAINMTAPGHSVLLTGCDPYRSGIVGNDYYDRKAGRMMYATEDTNNVLSPRNLLCPTIGQLLKTSSPHSKVFGIAIKDRAAILMTGLKADAAMWIEPDQGGLGTSAHYKKPSWLQEFNRTHDVQKFANLTWNPTHQPVRMPSKEEVEAAMRQKGGRGPIDVLPQISFAQQLSARDSVPWEGNFPGGGKNFPHTIAPYGSKNFWESFICTPYSIDWIMDAAKTCVQKERLGKGEHVDMLCVGISTTDEVGHLFGPNSREMKEIVISADKALADFIDFLDSEVGRDNYELIISGDHGVAEVPENSMMPSVTPRGRLRSSEIISFLMEPYKNHTPLSSAIVGAQAQKSESKEEPPSFVKQFTPPFLFLDSASVKGISSDFHAACDSIAARLRQLKGIGIAIPTYRIIAHQRPPEVDEATFELIERGVYAPRSGDIVFFPSEGWLFGSKTTTHGTPYVYDRWVPLMFFGHNLKHKEVHGVAHPEDIAPTLAEQLHLKLPHSDGKVLNLSGE